MTCQIQGIMYEAFRDGSCEVCHKDSVMISMRILWGFQMILLDSYKGFDKDSKGFYIISTSILLGSLSGFWRVSIGQAFYKNYVGISTIVP